jgi:hypothetical protein
LIINNLFVFNPAKEFNSCRLHHIYKSTVFSVIQEIARVFTWPTAAEPWASTDQSLLVVEGADIVMKSDERKAFG